MSFNKNTWSKDYTGAKGIKLLAADAARSKGFTPKHDRKAIRVASSETGKKEEGGAART